MAKIVISTKTVVLLVLSTLLLILVVWPLLKPGLILGMDGELHLGRLTAYTHALKALHFPVRWAATLQYDHGSPIFILAYPLPYFLGSIFLLSGLPLTITYKLLIALSLLSGGAGVYFFCKSLKIGQLVSLSLATVYVFAPYHLLNAYVRVALGELFLIAWPGWWLFFLLRYKRNPARKSTLLVLTLISNVLILSHQILGILTLGYLVFLTSLIFKPKTILPILQTLLFSVLLTAWFWLPAGIESKYTMLESQLSTKPVTDNLLSFQQLLYQPWSYEWRTTPVMIGIPLSIGLFLLGVVIFISKDIRTIVAYCSIIILILACTSVSLPLWQLPSPLEYFQTPWRLLNLVLIGFIVVLAPQLKTKRLLSSLILILAFFTVLDSVPKLTNTPNQAIDSNYYWAYPKSTAWHWEGTPVWTAGDPSQYPAQPFQLIGQGKIIASAKSFVQHTVQVEVEVPSILVDNTFYFPGWRAFVNDVPTTIEFQDINHRGLITLSLPPGTHVVDIVFGKTKVRFLAELVSVFGTIILLYWYRKSLFQEF